MNFSIFDCKKSTRVAVCLLLTVFLSACAVHGAGSPQEGQPVEQWVTFKEHATEPTRAANTGGVATLVFSRGDKALDGPAVNVFVDGQYAASLLAGASRKVAVCAGAKRITTAFTDVNRRYVDKNYDAPAQLVNVAVGQELYFDLVPVTGGQPKVQSMSEQDAARASESLKGQSHSLSRIDTRQCSAAGAAK
ncbi:MAG: hypothetical protein Q4G70_14790 [Pseudomonadota bacterium]|nr:hypothetical protein [Pseudomonadota bacterium]